MLKTHPREILTDPELGQLLMRAMKHPIANVKSSAASALGKMRWRQAWPVLKAIVEDAQASEPGTQRLRASACYACAELVAFIDQRRFAEAVEFFGRLISSRSEIMQVRWAAASGAGKLLIQYGYLAPNLRTYLLDSARDPDRTLVRNSWLALIHLPPQEILEDAILVTAASTATQRQELCLAAQLRPSPTGICLIGWLLQRDSRNRILISALYSISEILRKMADNRHNETDAFIASATVLDAIAWRCLELAEHGSPDLILAALGAMSVLVRVSESALGEKSSQYRRELTARARVLLNHDNPKIVLVACSLIGAVGTIDDLPCLASLAESTRAREVRAQAKKSEVFLKRRLFRRHGGAREFRSRPNLR